MMTKLLSALVLATLSAVGIAGPPAVIEIYKSADSSYWLQVVATPDTPIDMNSLSSLAHRFLTETSGRKAASLSIFPTRNVASWQTSTTCEHYKDWRRYFDTYAPHRFSAANLLSIRGDALMRVRDEQGVVSRKILKGKDPSTFAIGGIEAEILSISGRYISMFEGCQPSLAAIAPIVYVQTADLTVDRCKLITRWLADRLQADRLHVVIRNDYWFICRGVYAIGYPFKAITMPPSEQDYYERRAVSCELGCDGLIRCILVVDGKRT